MTREEILKNLVEEFYEDFNECERAQHLLDCEYCELYKKYGKCHLGEHITGYQMPIIEKAQADLLKEFVEWLKKRLDKQCTRLKNSDEFDLERSIGIHIVLANLDKHLEKFLEAKK